MSPTLLPAIRRTWASIVAHRTLLMAIGAIGFGTIAVVGARNYIGNTLAIEKARLNPARDMVELVVAKRDLRRGDAVGADTMAVRSVPREYAPAGAVLPAAFAAHAGAKIQGPMHAGDPLMASNLAASEPGSIAARIKPGVRAMTIAVDEVSSLSGMLQPGDRIDLMLSVRPPSIAGTMQAEVTKTVLQDVVVLATGRQSRASTGADETFAARPYTAITVEVDPERAQKLVVAQRSGKLTAVLRNPDDRQALPERRLDVNALLGLAVPVAVTAPVSGPQIIVGGRGAAAPVQSPMSSAPPTPAQDATAPATASTQSGPLNVLSVPPHSASGVPQGTEKRRDTSELGVPWSVLEPPKTVPLLR